MRNVKTKERKKQNKKREKIGTRGRLFNNPAVSSVWVRSAAAKKQIEKWKHTSAVHYVRIQRVPPRVAPSTTIMVNERSIKACHEVKNNIYTRRNHIIIIVI